MRWRRPCVIAFLNFHLVWYFFLQEHSAVNVPLLFRFGEVELRHEPPQVNILTPGTQRENTGLAPLSFPGNSGSAAAGEIRQGEEPTTAMNSTSNLGGNPGLAHIQYPSAGDSEDDTMDYALPVLEQLSRALMNYQMSYLQRKLSNIWSAHLMNLGPAEQQYCLHSHISPAILCQTTLRYSGVLHLLNQLLNLLQIQGFAPLGFSQQYETQQDTPEKVFYVEGAWCCNLLFRVEATQRDLQDEWTSPVWRSESVQRLFSMP